MDGEVAMVRLRHVVLLTAPNTFLCYTSVDVAAEAKDRVSCRTPRILNTATVKSDDLCRQAQLYCRELLRNISNPFTPTCI